MGLAQILLLLSAGAIVVHSIARFPLTQNYFNEETITTEFQDIDTSFRLPLDTVPTHYDIHLKTTVHDADTEFQGNVNIHLDVKEPTDKITIHSRDLEILSSTLSHIQGTEKVQLSPLTNTYNNQTEQLTFQSSSILPIGSYELEITFTGALVRYDRLGFLRKSYRDNAGTRRYLAATHFEPTGARMAFPCYDEPTLRATFTVSITHHASYNAVSNMPQDGPVSVNAEDPNYVTTTFVKSPNMSSYLLAFVVSDFETKSIDQQEIHARPNGIQDADFSLDAGVKILQKLHEYTGIDYYEYLPKVAQVAVPDWTSGAMENWGLVIYSEPSLLYNADINSYRTLISAITTIAHEYTHQWFGNLVAVDWSYLWMKEGFATLYGYYIAELAYPDEPYMDLFQVNGVLQALAQDSSVSTRPMNWQANTAAEIYGLFDTVAYQKAGSVLNMFRVVFGDDDWKRGMNAYLQKHALSTATPEDLYVALQSSVNLPNAMTAEQILGSWTSAAGYPVLNVRRNYRTSSVVISQERFIADRRIPSNHIWYIPYNFADEKEQNFALDSFNWLTKKASVIEVDTEPEQWLIFNRQQFGFYRVNYDPRNWEMIIQAMTQNPNSIHYINRAQLIDDAFSLARAELLDFTIVLRLVTTIANDRAYLPWAAVDKVLTYLNTKLRGTIHHERFEQYVKTLITNIYPTLVVDYVDADETQSDKFVKQLISTWACRVDYSDCRQKAETAFKADIYSSTKVAPDIQTVMYCYGIQRATNDEFIWLYTRLFNSINEAERILIINALGCSESKEQLEAYLTSSIGSGVGVEINYNDRERPLVLQAVYSAGRIGVDGLIDFLNNWDIADDLIYWLEQPVFNNAIANIASRTNTVQELDRLNQLLETVGTLAPEYVVSAAMATVKANLNWYDSLEGLVIAEYFEHRYILVVLILFLERRRMVLKEAFLCALVLSVAADRPQWRALDGVVEEEAQIDLYQTVDESYRLPTVTVPSHYNLHLKTAIHNNDREFQGTVEIFFDVLESTDTVTILNRGLSVWKITLYSISGEIQTELGSPEFDTAVGTEHLAIKHSSILEPGTYMVQIEYIGQLQDNNNQGFFASSYRDDEGTTHYLASSKFEPTHARSAFPCYDEPKLKATFTISITHSKDYHAVSNMPQEGELVPDVDDLTLVTTTFQKSTKMSTYLVAFAVTDFSIRTDGYQTVYARPNVYEETELGLQAGVDILNALSAYTGVEYTKYMPKMTQIAIPDRGSGAMENWGLVAYGEPVLLFNPSINTYRNKKNVVTIIAHEFAHQWFGNLVSPDWWDHIWLNEGFATVYEYYAAQLAYPEANYWDLWGVEVIQNAFSADASESVRPMTWNAATPSEIAALFDTVAYDKSGSVLNMFRVAFGDDNFREGLVSYFNSRELDSAIADHLYEGLELAVTGKDVLPRSFNVKEVMDSWTTVAGFPLLTVRRDYTSGDIYVSQERFYSDRQLPNTHVYHVPFNYASKSEADFDTLSFEWLSTKAAKLTTTIPADDWVIFNKQQTGYYRVNYDSQNWQLIIAALQENPSSINVQNRAQLINDAYNLARAERLDLAVPLELLNYLKQETAYPPWAAAGTVLTYFNNKLRGTASYPNFLNYVSQLIQPLYSTQEVDAVSADETVREKYVKQTITTWACRIGNQDCIQRSGAALKTAVAANVPVHPDIATVVYCYGLEETGETEFVWLYERLLASKNQAERAVLIDSLACSQNKEYLVSFLMTSIGSGATINYLETERTRIISSIYSASRAGVDALIDFFSGILIDEFISRLGQSVLNSAISNIASRTNNEAELEQLNTLLALLVSGEKITEATASSAKSTAEARLAWFTSLEALVAEEFFGTYTQ
ncbi:uncharacterized protein LOC134227480 [Armigeres subalbatus]|uniref:uncharacterized protein LOC134227480 n=1 Tax=Armigeres subalbatus TaxID=124917 RepID=UPI002ED3E339